MKSQAQFRQVQHTGAARDCFPRTDFQFQRRLCCVVFNTAHVQSHASASTPMIVRLSAGLKMKKQAQHSQVQHTGAARDCFPRTDFQFQRRLCCVVFNTAHVQSHASASTPMIVRLSAGLKMKSQAQYRQVVWSDCLVTVS